MFKLLLGIITIFSFVCFSQTNLTELQKQLPETVRENPELLKQISQTLQRDISLHPDLVAYRVSYYRKLFDEGIRDNELNGFNNLRLQTLEYYNKRNTWIENGKEIINRSSYSSNYKIKAIDVISEFYTEVRDTNIKADYNLDKNYVDYFATIALGSQNIGNYNPGTDYSKSRSSIEKIFKDNQTEKINFIGTKDDLVEPVDDIMNYWYLFPNNDVKKDFIVTDLLLKYFESKYNISDLPLNDIFIGLSFFQIKEEMDIKSSGNIIPNNLVLGNIKNATQLNLTFNKKFMIKDNLVPFAFLSVGLGGGLSFDAKTENKEELIVYQKDQLPDNGFVSQTWNITDMISKDPLRASAFIKITTPVLFFNKNIFFQIGFISGIDYASYKLQYSYSYDKVQVVWDESLQRFVSTLLERKIGEKAAEENSQTKFYIYPTVDLVLYSLNPVLFQFSAGYNFISAKIGYGF